MASMLNPAANQGAGILNVQIICPWPVVCLGAKSLLLESCGGGVSVSVLFSKTGQTDYFSLVDPKAHLLILIVPPGAVIPGDADLILGRKSRFHLLVLDGSQPAAVNLAGRANTASISYQSGLDCWRRAFRSALCRSRRISLKSRGVGNSNRSDPDFPGKCLTARQMQVLAMIAKGYTNARIAEEIGLSVGTVKLHVIAILRSLGVMNRVEAALRFNECSVSHGRTSSAHSPEGSKKKRISILKNRPAQPGG